MFTICKIEIFVKFSQKALNGNQCEVAYFLKFNYEAPIGLVGLWIKARGLGKGWTRPAGRAAQELGRSGNTSLFVTSLEQAKSGASYHG